MEPTKEQYESLYHLMVRETDTAIEELQNGACFAARNRLQAALLQCEELYLNFTDAKDTTATGDSRIARK